MKTIFFTLLLSSLAIASELSCFYTAYNQLNLNQLQSAQLCKNKNDNLPILCFQKAIQSGLNNSDSIALCENTTNYNPLICYFNSEELYIRNEHRISLCRKAKNNSPIECFKNISTKHSNLSNQIKSEICGN